MKDLIFLIAAFLYVANICQLFGIERFSFGVFLKVCGIFWPGLGVLMGFIGLVG